MSWATASEPIATPGHEVLLVSAEDIPSELARAQDEGMLPVVLPSLGPVMRGHLAIAIENAVEQALEARQSCHPGAAASSDLDASLSDQLYRARLVGATGLAIALGPLEGLANLAGALDAEDSAVLRWWIGETADRPVRLLVQETDRYLAVYGPPVPLQGLIRTARQSQAAGTLPDDRAPSNGASIASDALPDEPTPSSSAAPVEPTAEESTSPTAAQDLDSDLCQLAEVMASLFKSTPASTLGAPASEIEPLAAIDLTQSGETGDDALVESSPAELTPTPIAHRPASADGDPTATPVTEANTAPTPCAAPIMPMHPDAEQNWGDWMNELDAARGPTGLGAVERMFLSSYLPLAEAVSTHVATDDARPVLARWAANFAKSYADAFDTLALRHRRPTMVLDVPDLGMRLARLHGARTVQLLLVDGLRFDLGLRVHEHLKPLLGQRAILTERLLLWAALPTTTSTQLELIARGPDAMRRSDRASDSELPVARGRAASTLRRVKVGFRDLFKLDLVEAALSEAGGPALERLDTVARETAEVVANHFLRLPQRTLVMLFGDHGFLLEDAPGGTRHARQGGATPEEVLVPAFAWLVGNVH